MTTTATQPQPPNFLPALARRLRDVQASWRSVHGQLDAMLKTECVACEYRGGNLIRCATCRYRFNNPDRVILESALTDVEALLRMPIEVTGLVEQEGAAAQKRIEAVRALRVPVDSRSNLTEKNWLIFDSYNKGVTDALEILLAPTDAHQPAAPCEGSENL